MLGRHLQEMYVFSLQKKYYFVSLLHLIGFVICVCVYSHHRSDRTFASIYSFLEPSDFLNEGCTDRWVHFLGNWNRFAIAQLR